MNKLLENYKTQKMRYIEALVEKDHLEIYEYPLLKNDFVLKLGEPRYELHKIETEIARNKLKLDMMETCSKFKIPIDTDNINKQLEKEFEKNELMLRSMKKEIDIVHSIKDNTDFNSVNKEELKQLYISIASYIHPELVESADKKSKRIWKAVRTSYAKSDIAKLKQLHKKVLQEYTNASTFKEDPVDLNQEIESLKAKTARVKIEIELIKKQFPFNELEILEDENAVSKFRNDMDNDIKVAKEVLDKLEKQILEKLPSPNHYLN